MDTSPPDNASPPPLRGLALLRAAPQNVSTDWSQLRKSFVKDMLIENWVIQESTARGYTDEEMRALHARVMNGFQFKTLGPEAVVFQDGRIVHIHGLFNK
jgi:hypothetical protein